jgi:hypothetical protein
VTYPSSNLPNDVYFDGLRTADPETLAFMYREFRQPIVRTVCAEGGNPADGGVFFRAALLEFARLSKEGAVSEEIPVFEQIQALALAHYRDWTTERGQTPPAVPENEAEAPALEDAPVPELPPLPAPEALRLTRRKLFAWKKLDRLEPDCRQKLLAKHGQAPEIPVRYDADTTDPCVERFRSALQQPGQPGREIPAWAYAALDDPHGYELWQKTQKIERALDSKEIAAPKQGSSRTEMILRTVFGLLLLGSVVYYYYPKNKPAAKVYRDHFAPPESIMADLELRYGPLLAFDSATQRPEFCFDLLRSADAQYQNKNYRGAASYLEEIVDNEENDVLLCHSDAYFYLGLIGLQTDDPGYSLGCFSKVEDIERYGDDIYWYQALAFVKLAERRPDLSEKARRAVERAMSNTQDSVRRELGQKMLDKLPL